MHELIIIELTNSWPLFSSVTEQVVREACSALVMAAGHQQHRQHLQTHDHLLFVTICEHISVMFQAHLLRIARVESRFKYNFSTRKTVTRVIIYQ